jgi:hypothetical protein
MFPLLKKILLFCSPFLIILIVYIVMDPFVVLYNHEDYNKDFFINKNNDFVSTEIYLKKSKEINYDSFIFGSSTTLFISPATWKKYLNPANEVFSFNASSEHIIGIWSKINYLHLNNRQIKNALLVFDTNVTFGKFLNDDPLFMKHYKIYPTSKLNFEYKYFLNFIDVRFLISLVQYKLTHKFFHYMDNFLINKYYYFDPVSNEYYNVGILDELKNDSINYYVSHKGDFKTRTGKFLQAESQINMEYIQKLNDIKNIFITDNTNFRIIICPAYDQIAFNKEDLSKIQTIFGSQNVFDFSGINEFTEKKSNFYDELHFKKYVGNEMLDIAYSNSISE